MKLREWREKEGLTQAVLAAELGIHAQYLSDIERGVRTAGSKLALKIKRRSNGAVTPNDLLAAAEAEMARKAA